MDTLKRVGVLTLLAGLGCAGSSVAPLGSPLVYRITTLRCAGGCGNPSGPADTVRRGDTVLVVLSLADTLVGDSILVSLREPCAVNVSVLSGRTVRGTLPTAATCADSGYNRFISGTPSGSEVRRFPWVVDGDGSLDAGTYVLRGEMLLAPPLAARAVLVLQ
jgi:hypothetical protein